MRKLFIVFAPNFQLKHTHIHKARIFIINNKTCSSVSLKFEYLIQIRRRACWAWCVCVWIISFYLNCNYNFRISNICWMSWNIFVCSMLQMYIRNSKQKTKAEFCPEIRLKWAQNDYYFVCTRSLKVSH